MCYCSSTEFAGTGGGCRGSWRASIDSRRSKSVGSRWCGWDSIKPLRLTVYDLLSVSYVVASSVRYTGQGQRGCYHTLQGAWIPIHRGGLVDRCSLFVRILERGNLHARYSRCSGWRRLHGTGQCTRCGGLCLVCSACQCYCCDSCPVKFYHAGCGEE